MSYHIVSYHRLYHFISYHIISYHKIIHHDINFFFLAIQERIAHPPLLVLSTSTQVTSHISASQKSTQQHSKSNQIHSFIHSLFKSNGDSYSINSSNKLFRNSISLCLYCLLIFRFKVCDNIFIFLHYVYVSLRYCFQPFHLILLCAIMSTLL